LAYVLGCSDLGHRDGCRFMVVQFSVPCSLANPRSGSFRCSGVVRASSADERFRSAAAAHFWYEWQVKGIALPLVTLLMLFFAALGGIVVWYMQKSNSD